MFMKKLAYLFIVFLSIVPVSSALAQSKIPDLVGVWKVQGEGVLLNMKGNDSTQAKYSMDFHKPGAENVVEKQKGRLFYGYFKSPRKTEKYVGVISLDNKTAHWAGHFGLGQAKIVSPKKMEVIYLEANPQGSEAWVETLSKQK
jgi:hypothetical protein